MVIYPKNFMNGGKLDVSPGQIEGTKGRKSVGGIHEVPLDELNAFYYCQGFYIVCFRTIVPF